MRLKLPNRAFTLHRAHKICFLFPHQEPKLEYSFKAIGRLMRSTQRDGVDSGRGPRAPSDVCRENSEMQYEASAREVAWYWLLSVGDAVLCKANKKILHLLVLEYRLDSWDTPSNSFI